MKFVIFKENGKFKMTREDNYNARIRNANIVTVFSNCNSFEECLSCLPKSETLIYIDKTGD